MLGLAALTPEAVSGAVLQMVNHGISTGALFLIIGLLYERTHTLDLGAYGGVASVAPAIAATFVVVTLSSIGLPGTNGFVGEFLILLGTFMTQTLGSWHVSLPAVLGGPLELSKGNVLSVLAATGVVLGAVYMLWLVQRVFFGPKRKAAQHGIPDLSVREWFTVAPLIAAIVWIGAYPQPLLDAIKQPVGDFIQRVATPSQRPVLPGRQHALQGDAPAGLPIFAPVPSQPGTEPVQPRLFLPQRAPMAQPPAEAR
jgi:NADH-quinone oxidoreductase subunit M